MRTLLRGAAIAASCVGLLAACAEELDRPDPSTLWDGDGEQVEVVEPISFAPRGGGNAYGLPRDGELGIGDLIDTLPTERIDRDDPNIWMVDGDIPSTDQCQGGTVNSLGDEAIEIEGIVTLHPRQYFKLPVCGQDERFYGSYVVEDDTGGILVLRDGRVAPYTFGDRVRLRIRGVGLFYGQPRQRAVIAHDVELLPPRQTSDGEPDRTVLYREVTDADFGDDDIGEVRRVEGFVVQKPTNDNFNAMLIADRELPEGGSGEVTATCIETCAGTCRARCPSDGNLLCRETICPAACSADGGYSADALPNVCWGANIDAELGRRGFSPDFGDRVRVTAPVLEGFGGADLYIIRLGQVETLN